MQTDYLAIIVPLSLSKDTPVCTRPAHHRAKMRYQDKDDLIEIPVET